MALWQTLAWSTSGVALILLVYPYVIYPLALQALPKRPIQRELSSAEVNGREFALFFSAFNEERSIRDKLDNIALLMARYPELEVHAYNDASTDQTRKWIEESGLPILLINAEHRTGKAHGMKKMVSATDRPFLIFTDANVELQLDAIAALSADYSDPDVGGVCGHLTYRMPDGDGTSSAVTGGLYWRLEEWLKSAESRTGSVMGADGSIFSIRHECYPEFPDTVLDDLTVSMSPVLMNRRLIKDDRVIAFEDLVDIKAEDYRRRVRIATRAFHTHIYLRSSLKQSSLSTRWRYYSHRYFRWIGGFFAVAVVVFGLLGAFLTNLVAGIVMTAALLIVGCVGLARDVGVISSLMHMVASIFLTTWGAIKAMRGSVVTTWRTPRSS